MRVSHVITRLIVGGAQENTLSSVEGLHTRPDIDVELISGPSTGSEGSLEPRAIQSGVPFIIIPNLVRPIQPWADFRAYRSLLAHYKATRPDIVHTHSGKAGILGRLAARSARVPCIIHSIHGPSFGSFQGFFPNLLFKQAERSTGRFTKHFVVVAHAMRDQYLKAGIGSPKQYSRIFSGFDLHPYLNAHRDPDLIRKFKIQPEDFVVGKIARLFTLKGHDDLFAAAHELIRRIPNIKLLLVGDGPWRARFESMVFESPLAGRVIFTGLVPPQDVAKYVGLMDALVHLSRREGLPRAIPQALAAGKPVVAVDCDGANEACIENQTGFLVQPGDLAALVDRLGRLADDPQLRQRLGQAGREWVQPRFATEHMVDALHELYLRLVPTTSAPQSA